MDFVLLLTLIAGHYLADFGLQSQHMAAKKQLIFLDPMGIHALTSHAFIHAIIAGLLSGSILAAAIIGSAHWLIDFGKASKWLHKKLGKEEGLYGIHVDQALHIAVIFIVVVTVI
ncbi:MAG: DUF3307 domain-containing protein [Candidatus Saccharibacteria bacterium]|nr:DUF3307 domain-containing protein [Candidatus Saccharibacteria bacterium]